MKQPSKINIFGISIDNLTMQETLAIIEGYIVKREPLLHVGVNAGKLVDMQSDAALWKSVAASDMISVDGQAVVWASKFLGQPLKERVTGIDMMINLVALAGQKGYRCFFLGAKEEVVQKVVENYRSTYGEQVVAGYRNGYFTKDDEQAIVQQILDSNADMLFVAMTSPLKENFLYAHRKAFKKIPFIMGVGGSFDVIAGKVKRAPLWMQKTGLEWLYRLIQEPKRMFKRYLVGNTKFLLLTLREKFKKVN